MYSARHVPTLDQIVGPIIKHHRQRQVQSNPSVHVASVVTKLALYILEAYHVTVARPSFDALYKAPPTRISNVLINPRVGT
jgi:hypothetical protein